MLVIEHNNIHLTRGDDASFFVGIEVSDAGVFPDVMTMMVKDSVNSPHIAFELMSTYDREKGGFFFDIAPEDTNNLDFGDYVFDLEVMYDNNKRHTVLENHTFEIREEVCW